MPVRYVSSPPRAVLLRRSETESGSQTTEYALIMVVTATKLRGYDDPSVVLRPAGAGPCEQGSMSASPELQTARHSA
jgi:hypothetical protein